MDERRRRNISYGKLQRKPINNEPLKGKTLELALSFVTCDDPSSAVNREPFYKGIASKLKAGQPLGSYEITALVDVFIDLARIG